VTANDVNDVARQLWCPLCSGVRLDACELKACAQMKDVIGQKLAEGEDAGAIKNYFVAQYGPQVLGEPPLEGFNWLAWILPVLAMAAGGLLVWSRVHKSTQRAQAAGGAGSAAGSAAGGPTAPGGAAGEDPYGRKLEEELKHYD
jgi:cytochrome c-type biogenesis protein CcmH